VQQEVLVMAIRDELLVLKSRRLASPRLDEELSKIARNAGSLLQVIHDDDSAEAQPPGASMPDDVEIWRLSDPRADSIDDARRLRRLAPADSVKTHAGPSASVPAVSPNHVCVVAPKYDACPSGPPIPTPPPSGSVSESFVALPLPGFTATVVVIDSGYIEADPPHVTLDERVTSVPGHWLDTSTIPGVWRVDEPDVLDADHDGRLDGVAGHGTFISGLVAHRSRQAEITVVGQRDAIMPLSAHPDPHDEARLFSSEIAVARSVLQHARADVVSCGFAFPTLDGQSSVAFTSVMALLTGPDAPRRGIAVVAPAGNEGVAAPYWPAAHPDVIGVAATNRRGRARAHFSNWGEWANCCARGEDVFSTYITWDGPVEGEPPSDIDNFIGWAVWNGTSFAAPKVSAEIARLVAESAGALLPVDAFQQLLSGAAGVEVTPLTDMTLSGFPGVTLPHLHLG
jgi:Subtilase family